MCLKLNDEVMVTTPNGDFQGKITQILPNYSWTGDTWYLVRGPDVETIARPESIRGQRNDER